MTPTEKRKATRSRHQMEKARESFEETAKKIINEYREECDNHRTNYHLADKRR